MQVGVSRSSATIISKKIEADYIADGSGTTTSSYLIHYMTLYDMTPQRNPDMLRS